MPSFKNLTDQRFNRLVVIRDCEKKRYWLCLCDCGNTKEIRGSHLSAGLIQSCGCLHKEKASARTGKLHKANTKSGLSASPTYQSWCGIKQRCNNPNNSFYHYYGGRGIVMCDRWLNSFENFLVDMGRKPKGMTIDRIDNNGHYEPSNCRWSTRKEQANNRRINRVYTIYGKELNLTQISELFGIHRNTLDQRLAKGMSIEKAVIPPKKHQNLTFG